MSRPVIGVLAESYEDFREHIDPLIDETEKSEKDTVKTYRTTDIWYQAIINPMNLRGITFNDVLITKNAHKNKRILDTLKALLPNLYPLPLGKTVELNMKFNKLEIDFKNKLK